MAKRKYDPLKSFLVANEKSIIRLPLRKIAEMVSGLPADANTPQFWANTNHHKSRRDAWLTAGYHAFFEKNKASVRFERQSDRPTKSRGWKDAELKACVEAYRTLWLAEQKGSKLNKSALRRKAVKGPLKARSEGAYERRMQNISAVLIDLGIPRVAGYKPLNRVGEPRARLKAMIHSIWTERQPLAIVTSKAVTQDAFRRWHEALLETPEFEGSVGWLPIEEISFSAYSNAKKGEMNEKTALGIDPDGRNWVLEINKPQSPSTENGSSAIGEDPHGNLFLLRQGVLHANNLSERIEADEFEALSSVPAVPVTLDGVPTKRRWFMVTAISDSFADMRRSTASFVKLCARVRGQELTDMKLAKADLNEINERFGTDEGGGTSTFWRTGGSRVVHRRHGEVWQALKAKLAEGGKTLRKPSHARGYETDGEVVGKGCDLLLEIKTGCSAADVYTGVGQLQVYPKMLGRLSNHLKVLLLPDKPSDELILALTDLDIQLYVYSVREIGNWTSAVFPQKFLELCGLNGR